MDFESAKKCADRLGVTVRAIQKWAKEGKIEGAKKIGREWMIPVTFNSVHEEQKPMLFLPLTSAVFEVGKIEEYIESIELKEEKELARGEYFYYKGEFENATETLEPYLDSENLSAKMTAALICTFSNLAMKHLHLVHYCANILKEIWNEAKESNRFSQEDKALIVLCTKTLKTQLQIDDEIQMRIGDYIPYLPDRLKPFACFLMAYKEFLEKKYEYSLGLIDSALILDGAKYPISAAYLYIMAAINRINLMMIDEANQRVEFAHKLIYPDSLLMPIVEHHTLMQGTAEAHYKDEHPETYKKIMDIAKNYNTAWYEIYNKKSGKNVAENLTTTEFTIAMLYSRKWKIKDIAEHLKISERTVKNYLQIIYEKLYINNRKDLEKYILS